MKVAIPGGTGQVATILARAFHNDGHDLCERWKAGLQRRVPLNLPG
jgi:hypothetical protein